MSETAAPYGTGPAAPSAPVKRVRTHHLQEMKERGEKWAMLTAYDQYTAEIFDEAGIAVLLVGDSAANNVFGYETTLPVTVDELLPLVRAVVALDQARPGRRRPAVRLLRGGPGRRRSRTAVRFMKEAGGHAVKLEGGRRCAPQIERDHRRRHPGDGAHRLHPAERARTSAATGCRAAATAPSSCSPTPRPSQEAGAFAVVLEMVPGEVAKRGHRRAAPSRPSASAPGPTATPRCSSGRTWPACAPAGCRGSSSSTPTCTACCPRQPQDYADDVRGGTFPGRRAHLLSRVPPHASGPNPSISANHSTIASTGSTSTR